MELRKLFNIVWKWIGWCPIGDVAGSSSLPARQPRRFIAPEPL
jgi:hypothetical protein